MRPGDHLAIAVPEPEAFIRSFFGASVAGLVPVPMYPPFNIGQLETYLRTTEHILEAGCARAILTTGPLQQLLGLASTRVQRPVLVLEELEGEPLSSHVPVQADSLSFIQFTSGSTSKPKGVMLPHAALLANVKALARWTGGTESDTGVSWLPLFHDMGLIGMMLVTLWVRARAVLMSPITFAKYPGTWLKMISRYQGTVSFAPNFAYALATRRVKESDLAALDLSSWRVAGCGAEPIQVETLRAFAARFALAGFRETSFSPCYGMAEHTLAISLPPLTRPLCIDVVRAEALVEQRRAIPCQRDEEGARELVSCGRALPGHAIRIVDDEGRSCGDREIGEILAAGPSIMRGYFREEDLTRAALSDGWLRTGDLGYLAEGELFVCGRKKDLIILSGRNYHPQDIEWAVHDLPGIRAGCVVAFAAGGFEGPERLIIASEVFGTTLSCEAAMELIVAIHGRVADSFGLRPDDVVLVPQGTLPKTSSGKLQRARTRARYETGTLARVEEE